jgi:hypothetical protein
LKLLRAVVARLLLRKSWGGHNTVTETPTFDEFVDVLRLRMFDADALNRGELHDVHELMSNYEGKVGDNWYEDAFDELKAQGHLDSASVKTMGPRMHARLSADGKHYVRSPQPEED